METIKTVQNQTVFDIAVQHYGTGEAVGEIMRNNPGLRNDPAALAELGIDYMADSAFYADAALRPNQNVAIDPDSKLRKQSVTRELPGAVTTFDL